MVIVEGYTAITKEKEEIGSYKEYIKYYYLHYNYSLVDSSLLESPLLYLYSFFAYLPLPIYIYTTVFLL